MNWAFDWYQGRLRLFGRQLIPIDDTIFHHKADALRKFNVLQRIAGHRHDIGKLPRF